MEGNPRQQSDALVGVGVSAVDGGDGGSPPGYGDQIGGFGAKSGPFATV